MLHMWPIFYFCNYTITTEIKPLTDKHFIFIIIILIFIDIWGIFKWLEYILLFLIFVFFHICIKYTYLWLPLNPLTLIFNLFLIFLYVFLLFLWEGVSVGVGICCTIFFGHYAGSNVTIEKGCFADFLFRSENSVVTYSHHIDQRVFMFLY